MGRIKQAYPPNPDLRAQRVTPRRLSAAITLEMPMSTVAAVSTREIKRFFFKVSMNLPPSAARAGAAPFSAFVRVYSIRFPGFFQVGNLQQVRSGRKFHARPCLTQGKNRVMIN